MDVNSQKIPLATEMRHPIQKLIIMTGQWLMDLRLLVKLLVPPMDTEIRQVSKEDVSLVHIGIT